MDLQVKITLSQKEGNTKAFAYVTVGNFIGLPSIVVMNGSNGLFVKMPQQKGSDNEWHDVFFPVTKEAREELSKAVLDAYQAALAQPQQAAPQQAAPQAQPTYQQAPQGYAPQMQPAQQFAPQQAAQQTYAQPQFPTDAGLPFN